MARPIQFDRNQAVAQAMSAFWKGGFQGTPVRELVKATGLKPGSLYGAFGNKRALFMMAMDVYFDTLFRKIQNILRADKPPLDVINDFFEQLVTDCSARSQGCLLVNTLTETPVEDHEVQQLVATMFDRIKLEFVHILDKARKAGDISRHQDVEELARMLITCIYGLRLYSKTDQNRENLRSIAQNFLKVLKM